MEDVGLDERNAGQPGPEPGEQVAEVLTDGDTEQAVERLEGDVDRGERGRRGVRI